MDDLDLPELPPFAEGRYHPLLGTDVRIQVWADDQAAAQAAEQAALAEMVRLQDIFSIFEPTSELSRWRRGEIQHASEDLLAALREARQWFVEGDGTFHPASRPLQERWRRAASEGVLPDRAEMQGMADRLRELPWRKDPLTGSEEQVGDCSSADLNAFVKGWIVDRAVEVAINPPHEAERVGVNAGGDLRHHGSGTWRVGVEDPLHPSDNRANRLCMVGLSNAAMATSGFARRGFRVGERWFGHVIDPRTGWPVQHLAQVSIVTPDAGSADALATICGVLAIEESLALIEGREGCECLLVDATGGQHPSSGWATLTLDELGNVGASRGAGEGYTRGW
ncbi:MAG: FAD:protein FMN transferase [Luteococcus sp.]|uniref:FAD:protein FMN transferase n=1 Tax=Luteococcus sp. TaxID=1969402 RepID=UPI00264A1131|nr:FAD:protein FMN transferase [Luteococcus sp.]MDN5564955.1 FAD:protein FMN transferase [Luteococcus sp.]